MHYSMKCVHGADGARLDSGWLRAPLCEHCNNLTELDRAFHAPSYKADPLSDPTSGQGALSAPGLFGYISLMPEE